MWAKADNVECCAPDEPIHHVSISVGGWTNPQVPIVHDKTKHFCSFPSTVWCCLNFHGIYEVDKVCFIRWLYVATRLQPHWASLSFSTMWSPFLSSCLLNLLFSLPEMLWSQFCKGSFSFSALGSNTASSRQPPLTNFF